MRATCPRPRPTLIYWVLYLVHLGEIQLRDLLWTFGEGLARILPSLLERQAPCLSRSSASPAGWAHVSLGRGEAQQHQVLKGVSKDVGGGAQRQEVVLPY